ncbi:hypothetical protein SAMN04489725_12312 [Alicyclobacillus hesperidum]|uniref:TrbL/VirB6 plasmid conjugal transfer protein n=1 Tax=Alicyclobacillus hesperidum TaxID=89784 RepID=A0A1H2XNC3_9BACL|nr:hypothetical protein [Alicyclobacillus hesperidum]SDW94371.1 hypothetical protein SAMN04489725_12312 [Alicyclobacillus hesperidum]
MNWFAGLIANLINALANGLQSLLDHTVAAGNNLAPDVMGNIILGGYFHNAASAPSWGTGSFSDVMDAHAVASLEPFATTFWVFGWSFFLISIYLLVVQVSGVRESAVQRERMKQGVVGLIVSALLIWQGQHLALLVTELFYYASDYFLHLGAPQKWTPLSTSGGQALLNSIVNFLQALLAFIVWIVYEFREVFLYVWMLFFPLAMAFYANDKTRGITKVWWTEWVYQMAVPLGQAVVYGVASAVASPASGTELTAEDVFVALAGTIGLLSSAVYVRKLIDVVAQAFGASLIGSDHGMRWGNLAMVGASAVAGDLAGKMAVTGTAKATGATIGKMLHAADNQWGSKAAQKQMQKRAEVHASAIKSGASIEDIMMQHKLGSQGDVLHADGAGLEASGGQAPNARPGGVARAGKRYESHTVGALADAARSVKQGFVQSHAGLWLQTKWQGYQNEGGVTGRIARRTADASERIAGYAKRTLGDKPWVGKPVTGISNLTAGLAQKYQTHDKNRTERLEALRANLREVAELNQLKTRLPSLASEWMTEADSSGEPSVDSTSSPSFASGAGTTPSPAAGTSISAMGPALGGQSVGQGQARVQLPLTQAEKRYEAAKAQWLHELQRSGMSPSVVQSLLVEAETKWKDGKHLSGQGAWSPEARQAYREAFTAYRPALLDQKARDAVQKGRLVLEKPKDPHKVQTQRSKAFLDDARNAIMYRR